MGYTRDKNAATRGAGAIAARDLANPRATAIREARRKHMLALRDKALSHMTYGRRGGIALGAISKASAGILKNMMAPTIATTGVLEAPVLKGPRDVTVIDTRPPYAPPPLPTSPLPPKPRPPILNGGLLNKIKLIGDARANVTQVNTNPMTQMDPVVVTAPTSGNTGIVPPGVSKPPGVVTGGGGGGGWPPKSGNTGIVPPDLTPLPDVPEDAPAASSPSSSNKTLLIVAAAAIGAYLIFGKDGE